MHPPTGKFSKLSLSISGMAPVTRSQSQNAGDSAPEGVSGGPVGLASAEHRSFAHFEADDEDDEEEDEGPVRSPLTSLFYNVDNLDDETQELVRELFRQPAPEETPPMVIEWCGISNDPDVYAFQLQEVVPRTIRIGSPTSRIPKPSCNCTGSESKPCRHLVWLMDQIAKQTLHDHHPDQPLVLEGSGFPRELGNAYSRISDFHIGILANTLHCGAGPPNGRPNLHRVREAREILAGLDGIRDDVGVDKYKPEIFDIGKGALESLLWGTQRRIYSGDGSDDEDDEGEEEDEGEERNGGEDSSQSSSDDEEGHVHRTRRRRHQLRGAVQGETSGYGYAQVRDLVERGDLQRTVLRLLVSNDEFFAMFLKLLAPYDKARDPFRKIQQRVESVLEALLALQPDQRGRERDRGARGSIEVPGPLATGSASTGPVTTAAESVSVAWAAQHIKNAVEQIRLLLQQQVPHPPEQWARRSAGGALVWILHALVFRHNRDAHAGATQNDRNLYQRLIGNSDGGRGGGGSSGGGGDGGGTGFFLLDELQPLHDQVQFRAELERIRHRIQVNGYREPYMHKLDTILAQMRAATKATRPGKQTSGEASGGRRSNDSGDSSSNFSDGDSGETSPTQLVSRGPAAAGVIASVATGSGGQSGRSTTIPPAAGSKRQGSGTGTSSDRRRKRMR